MMTRDTNSKAFSIMTWTRQSEPYDSIGTMISPEPVRPSADADSCSSKILEP